MPFGLKNAGATYQRLVDKAFQKQIDRNLEVYVDDLVIKSHMEHEIIRDMEETFKTLKEINMTLNPKKCSFEIKEGTFMGYKVNTEGIMVCPDKVGAVLNLSYPKCLKDIQKLNGKLASLNRFLSKSVEKSLPFFKTLKKCTKKSDFQWTAEAKRQILADFIVERPEDDSLDTPMEAKEELSDPWTLFTNGSSCVDGSGAGLILTNPEGAEFTYALRFRFNATNNEAEYEALMASLRIAEQVGVKNLQANVDSRLVANQHARRNKICSSKSHTDRILLANNACGCKKINKGMSRLLGSPPRTTKPVAKIDSHHVPVPLYKWGIAGPFPEGPGKVKFLIVAMDYFTKWIKAKHVATINGNQVKKFVWDNIVYRFGLPGEIISDNRKQFRDNPFKDWCKKLCIRQCFATVKHPQANCLVERENRSLEEGIKARLEVRSKDWIKELPHVLLAHRTMIKSSNGDTPFSLMYKTKAVIPAKISMPAMRTMEVYMVQNDEALKINIDLLEERREQAVIREARARQKWKNITTLKSATQASNLGIICIKAMRPAMQKRARSLVLSGKDHIK
ncbi:reverse transcriptase domain-containing protein [Tanacetum coccineum]